MWALIYLFFSCWWDNLLVYPERKWSCTTLARVKILFLNQDFFEIWILSCAWWWFFLSMPSAGSETLKYWSHHWPKPLHFHLSSLIFLQLPAPVLREAVKVIAMLFVASETRFRNHGIICCPNNITTTIAVPAGGGFSTAAQWNWNLQGNILKSQDVWHFYGGTVHVFWMGLIVSHIWIFFAAIILRLSESLGASE